MPQRLKTDWILFSTVTALVFFGVVILYSASSVMANLNPKFGSPYYFVLRQVVWMLLAIPVMMFLKRTHYRKLQNPAVAFSGIGGVLILLLAVYFIDRDQHRWLRMGFIGVQPAELAKPALVLFLAFFIALRARAINNRYTLWPAAIAVGLMTLGVVVADLGTAIVLTATAAVVFFVAGLEWRYCCIAVVIALLGAGVAVASKPYRLARVIAYFDPEFKLVDRFDRDGCVKNYLRKSLTARDTNYQAQQSKIAVGSGGLFGRGLMRGMQKFLYLPVPHTDTIYAVVGEELGFVGATAVLLAFLIILWRGIRATILIPDDFGRYLALGITTMVVVQALINISVVLAIVPTKGIPLPMISAGGSSLFSTLASLGILMNVSDNAG